MKSFIKTFSIILLTLNFNIIVFAQPAAYPQTYCNPLNLNYRFMSDAVDAREAADPVIVLYKGDYYLFASRSGGYWTSPDLSNWELIVPTGLDNIETYAPAVMILRDTLFYAASANGQTFKCADPKAGVWEQGPSMGSYGDPAFFIDDDERLYMYYGLSNTNPTSAVELDPWTFEEIGSPVNIVYNHADIHGWERRGDDNLLDEQPWIEGCWMIKSNDKYYLHYSAPGTEFKTYADGIYVADAPMGPFEYADYSPFSFKPTGFITGAGHGCTFRDKEDKLWRITTMVISVKHMFERRLGLYPVSVDTSGQIRCNTEFADYPQFLPGIKDNPVDENFAEMFLLSHKKFVTASSFISGYEATNAVDEEVRTYWAAQSGNPGEWILLDLGKECDIQAVQINFAEHGTSPAAVRGRDVDLYEQYTVETSDDGLNWDMLIDKSQNTRDVPHDYVELESTVQARYLKLTNVYTPGGGKFAVRGFRVFGNQERAVFTPVGDVTIDRDAADGRDATIKWTAVENADGYIIHYGTAMDKLHNHYMVYDADSVVIHSLNHGVDYFFEVLAFDNNTDYYRSAGEFRTGQSGDWNDINSWEWHNGTEWTAASVKPGISDGPVTIREGHTITVTANDTADQVTVESSGNLIVNTGVEFYLNNSIGNDLIVNGTLSNSGIIGKDSLATIAFGNGGKYEHTLEGGSLPESIWGIGSTCEISGYVTGSKPGNLNQDFYNFIWSCSGQTSNVDWGWYNNTINGDITVTSTGSTRAYLTSPGAGSPNTIVINGDINVAAGQFSSNGSGSIADITVNTYGNINVTGGNFSVSRGSGPTVNWHLFGNFAMSNATTQNSNPDGATFIFSGTDAQTLNLGAGNILTALPIEVSSGAILKADSSIISGAGKFILHPGATLETAHASGIDGIFDLDQLPQLSTEAGYSFSGSIAQVTGLMMPDTVADLIINNSSGVTLSGNVLVNGILELKNGNINPGEKNLVFGENSSLKYSGIVTQSTSDIDFPEASGPKNLIINNSKDVELHESRSIPGNLELLSGELDLGTNTLTAGSASNASASAYANTKDGGYLKMPVATSQTFFPIGNSTYAPVWITNSGVADTIAINVVRDNTSAPYGGRVRHKWAIEENISGGGDYAIQFGWTVSSENTAFRTDREGQARLYLLPDFIQAGTGDYTMQFVESPYTLARGGITELGSFVIGAFSEFPDAISSSDPVPGEFKLHQNFPNPFNPETIISWQLAATSQVELSIYNVLGQKIRTLISEKQQPGEHAVTWNAQKLASGIYYYRIKAGDFIKTKRMLLIK